MAFRIFIGSSSKAERLVTALQANLERHRIGDESVEVLTWMHAFGVGEVTIDALLHQAEECDAAIFIFSHDDFLNKMGNPVPTDQIHQEPNQLSDTSEYASSGHFVGRDNVVLELGIFMGRLGRDRVFFAIPKDHADFKLPSNLNGVIWAIYNSKRPFGEERCAMQESCDAIISKISKSTALPPRPKLAELLKKLDDNVAYLVASAQTRAVRTFPSFFEDHICRIVEKAKDIWIASDVLHYGSFSVPRVCNTYLGLLQDRGRNADIIIPIPSRRREISKRQIPPDEWEEKFTKDKEFRSKVAAFEILTGHQDIQKPDHFYDAAVKFEAGKVGAFQRQRARENSGPLIMEMDAEMPIYLWIGDDDEAVFSIPIDKIGHSSSAFEHGFITRDKDLIRALRATWERYRIIATKRE